MTEMFATRHGWVTDPVAGASGVYRYTRTFEQWPVNWGVAQALRLLPLTVQPHPTHARTVVFTYPHLDMLGVGVERAVVQLDEVDALTTIEHAELTARTTYPLAPVARELLLDEWLEAGA